MVTSTKIKILYTIPNFDTAGSKIPLLKIVNNLDKNYFEPQIACLHNRGDLFQDVKESGIKVHIIDLYKNARPIIKMLRECYQLSQVFKKINPHIIHSYNYSADYTEPLAAKMAGKKWIYTKKNMGWNGPSYRGWKLRSWLADGIICQNRDMLKDFFPNWEKVQLIPIGVDVGAYRYYHNSIELKKQLSIPENKRIIISIANLIPIKGIEILIEAFKEVIISYPDWYLLIVGDDTSDYAKGIKKITSENIILRNKIIFTGKQRNIRELLNISEIYVQPSLSKGEGSPIAILEAMANGKVIIGSDVPGIRDQLNKFPQHLFQPGDILDLKNKLIEFISNDNMENTKIGNKFFDYVLDNYDLNIEKEKLQNYYLKLIKKIVL